MQLMGKLNMVLIMYRNKLMNTNNKIYQKDSYKSQLIAFSLGLRKIFQYHSHFEDAGVTIKKSSKLCNSQVKLGCNLKLLLSKVLISFITKTAHLLTSDQK